MSLPPEADLFESGLDTYKPSLALQALLRQYLEAARSDIKMSASSPPTPPPAPMSSSESAALLNELGEYFTRTAKMWSSLTEQLMRGPHIEVAMNEALEHSHSQTAFSNLNAAAAIDLEIGRLRKIRDLTARYSQDVQAVWRPGRLPPMQMVEHRPSIPISHLVQPDHLPLRSGIGASFPDFKAPRPQFNDRPSISSSQMEVDTPPAQLDDNDSGSDDEEGLFDSIDMDALKQRGKGTYTCPKGLRCEKGGVENGMVVIFDRNSAYLQHLNKHRRPWHCDVPGCPNPPNKRKFARRDGLERHKNSVKHC
ncbi:hypothetical protein VHEMI06764 [[Torrubiella] hemipterigena]|uniref:Uncharacterized protein n=1 Tax=[Torrubiella] hemipterigena TaxID=1531966 RepID=A0A0A1TJW7_9HYPO|nr:hypothetical protein VHEMI06764 [[Torrubiella] hemipterigena]